MHVYIPHQSKKRKYHKLLEEATRFYARKLLQKKDRNGLFVQLSIRKTGLTQDYGNTFITVHNRGKQKRFQIDLYDSPHISRVLKTLAHEMVHVKQKVKNELRFIEKKGETYGKWKGETINYIDLDTLYEHVYHKLPWEEEAFKKEKTLYKSFVIHHNKVRRKREEQLLVKEKKMEKELEIGKIYRFIYDKPKSDHIPKFKKPKVAVLNSYAIAKLERLYASVADQVKSNFKARREELKEYLDTLSELETTHHERKANSVHRKTDEEKELEQKVTELKAKHFSKDSKPKLDFNTKDIDDLLETSKAFYRRYQLDRIHLVEDDGSNKVTRAVYLGKDITPTGKVVHNFVKYGSVVFEKEVVDKLHSPLLIPLPENP